MKYLLLLTFLFSAVSFGQGIKIPDTIEGDKTINGLTTLEAMKGNFSGAFNGTNQDIQLLSAVPNGYYLLFAHRYSTSTRYAIYYVHIWSAACVSVAAVFAGNVTFDCSGTHLRGTSSLTTNWNMIKIGP